jgi:CheY-like chemotaxis protein
METMDKKILLVEDNLINIKVTKLFLKECGYANVLLAQSGREALALFSPDITLVMLDIGLPDISGILVCRQLRYLLNGKPLPIIGYTAFGSQTEKECIAAGMDDFLAKPIHLPELKAMIQRYLGA